MNVVPLNATSPAAADQLADLLTKRASTQTLTGSSLRNASPEVQRAQVAQQFEAILVRQLLGPTMSSMLADGDSKGGGAGASVYGDMLTDSFAQQLTHAGGGLGLARMLEKQLAPRVPHTAPATAASVLATTPPQS